MRDYVDLAIRRRHAVVTVLRLGGLIFIALGLLFVGKVVLRALLWSGLGGIRNDYDALTIVATGLVMTGIGIVLAATGSRLARWLVPLPRRECPKCGYGLARLQAARCPECGLELPEAFAGTSSGD